MPIQFPTSPTDGQVYSGYYYDAALNAWKASPISAGPIAISDTAPAGAIHGDMWYKSNDGTTYIYYNDGNTSQWVEVRSEVATSQIGLVPIMPTSISVSSGTASSSSNTTTFTGVGSISLNGIFSSTYSHYRIILSAFQSTTNTSLYKFRNGGGDVSGALYYFQEVYATNTTIGASGFANQTSGRFGYFNANTWSTQVIDVTDPATTVVTQFVSSQGRSGPVSVQNIGGYNDASVFSGLTLIANGTLSGTVQIFGYKG